MKQEIDELENYFGSIELPTTPVQISSSEKVINCSKMIKSEIETLRANIGNKTFIHSLERLKKLKTILENSNETKQTKT